MNSPPHLYPEAIEEFYDNFGQTGRLVFLKITTSEKQKHIEVSAR
jgi:hypothetical protein